MNYLLYLILFFASLFGKMIIFIFPVFELAELRLSDALINQKELDHIFEDSNDINKLFKMFIALLLKYSFILGVGAILALLIFGFAQIGIVFDQVIDNERLKLFDVFLYGGISLGTLGLMISAIYLAPVTYLIYNNNSVSEAFHKSLIMMREGGKTKLFLIMFYHLLIVGILFTLYGYVNFIAFNLLISEAYIVIMTLLLIILVFLLPLIYLSYRTASISFIEEKVKAYELDLAIELDNYQTNLKQDLVNELFNAQPMSHIIEKTTSEEEVV
ncbi:hypothetical protein [Acholeplasma equifetale]|uniref:hypothetical protein n=1 Tax=Acholeplasma equifetale TaxID=264634 RepID=UPI00138AF056|nr:hypothetical protein [Acholeplasma equifetale]